MIALVSGLETPASATGYPPAAIQRALDAFKGVRRRQEVRGVADGVTVVDDFAHHPTAVRLTVEAMRGRYPGRRLWAVFEPRSFTARGGRFQREFTDALAGADRVVLARPFASEVSAGIVPLDVDAIAAVSGIDVLWIGQFDLTTSLGIPGQFDHSDFHAAVNRVVTACRQSNKAPGYMATGVDEARRRLAEGFRMLAYGGDLWIYQQALREGIDAIVNR